MVTQFGTLLRFYRDRCQDAEKHKNKLTQARLAELLSQEIGAEYSYGAVSEWERGQSQIHKDDRHVLVGLIKVFNECGGLKTVTEANTLLEAGNYRRLNEEELKSVFPGEKIEGPDSETGFSLTTEQWRLITMFLDDLLFHPLQALQRMTAAAAEEPPPHWPRVLLAVVGWPFHHLSSADVIYAVLWIAIWLLTRWLTFPILNWPFMEAEQAYQATITYVVGALIIPTFIGMMTRTRGDGFWGRNGPTKEWILRLYTHQGAMIGFHIGYVMVFVVVLAGYYFGVRHLSPLVQLVIAGWPLVLGYAAAHQVPLNLWRAYGRIELGDGGIFFVFIGFGPLFGLLFLYGYPLLLAPVPGMVIILSAIGLLAVLMYRQRRSTGSSVIPAYIWALIFGTIFTLNLIVSGASLFQTAVMAGIIGAIVVLLARERIQITLKGLILFTILLWIIIFVLQWQVWIGRGLFIVGLLAWWRWGKAYFWLPLSFWGVTAVAGAAALLLQHEYLSELTAVLAFVLVSAAILYLEVRR